MSASSVLKQTLNAENADIRRGLQRKKIDISSQAVVASAAQHDCRNVTVSVRRDLFGSPCSHHVLNLTIGGRNIEVSAMNRH